MKTSLMCRTVVAGSLLILAASAGAAIKNTKHNLGSGGTGTNALAAGGTDEVCVFCHTPHGSNTSATAPLWNRLLSTGTYQTYASLNSATLDAEEAPVGSVSMACLSCHDGTQAMNTVINAPGSGNYDPVSGFGLGAFRAGDPAQTGTPSGSLNYSVASVVNLGLDLRNDHPIGIQYAGGGADETTPTPATTAMNDTDFKAVQHGSTALSGGGTAHYWWVDTGTGGAGTREKTDMILYTRTDFPGGAAQQPSVECASCHDPHTETATFLRIAGGNAESAVCLACHTK